MDTSPAVVTAAVLRSAGKEREMSKTTRPRIAPHGGRQPNRVIPLDGLGIYPLFFGDVWALLAGGVAAWLGLCQDCRVRLHGVYRIESPCRFENPQELA